MKYLAIHALTALAAFVLSLSSTRAQEFPPRKTLSLPGGKAAEAPAGPYKADWHTIASNY